MHTPQHTSSRLSWPFADRREVRLRMATIRPNIRTRDFACLSKIPISLTDSRTSQPFSFPFAAISLQNVGTAPVLCESVTKILRGEPSARSVAVRIVKTNMAKIILEYVGDVNEFSFLRLKRRSLLVPMILSVPKTLAGKPRTGNYLRVSPCSLMVTLFLSACGLLSALGSVFQVEG
jgi:hypothetical protein